MTKLFNLYSSEGCHLCELALAICVNVNVEEQVNIVDIVEEEKLIELYGVHIPVLERLSDNKKLFWPFTAQQITELL